MLIFLAEIVLGCVAVALAGLRLPGLSLAVSGLAWALLLADVWHTFRRADRTLGDVAELWRE